MSCALEVLKNLGLSRCNEFPHLPKGMIETPDDFSVSAATAADPALLLTALKAAAIGAYANRIYFWPFFDSLEDIAKEAAYEDTPLSYLAVDDGQYRFRFGISQNLCLHKAMYTHRRNNGRVFIIDKKNKLIGTELSTGNFAGLSIQMLHTEKLKFNDGSVSTKSPIVIGLRDNLELDKKGYMASLDTINELYRIVDIVMTLAPTDNTTTNMYVDVKAVCDATPISGLLAADFSLVDNDDGVAHAISSVTESSTVPGRYTITGTAFEASVLSLRSAALLTVKAYEVTGTLAIPAP